MTQEEKEAYHRLRTYLKEHIQEEQERENLEQFLLVFYFDLLKKHSDAPFTSITEPLIEKGMVELYVPHIALKKSGAHPLDLRNAFLKELYDLCSASFGADSNGAYTFEPKSTDKHIEKYFFKEYCSIKIDSVELVFDEDFIPNVLLTEVGVVVE